MLAILQTATLALLSAVVVAGLPILAVALLWSIVHTLAPSDFDDVPILRRLAVIGGVLVAVTLVFAGPTAASFNQGRLLAVGGPWDISLGEFLTERIVAIRIAPEMIRASIDTAEWWSPEWWRVAPAFAGLGFILFASALAFRYWRDRRALRAGFAVVLAAIGMAFIAFYVAEAALWLLHKMNFWSLGIIAMLYQRHRNRLNREH